MRLLVLALACALASCSDGEATCPPDFPVMRDGFCYAADGGRQPLDASAGDAAASDAGSTGDDGGTAGEDASATDGGVSCMGRHPNVEGMRRFCDPGFCYCGDMAMRLDACYPADVAAACCPVDVVCESPADAGTMCRGTHPLLDAGARFCSPGNCYCADPDACFPTATAAACCRVDPVCL